jgi:hypothetical protein
MCVWEIQIYLHRAFISVRLLILCDVPWYNGLLNVLPRRTGCCRRIKEILGRTNHLFLLIRHGPHRKRPLTILRRRENLFTEPLLSNDKGMHREDPQIIFLYDTDRIENDASNSSYIVDCICCRGNVFSEPLPSSSRLYWWKGFMKYAVEMGSGAMIYIPSFIKIGSGNRTLIERIHRHTDSKVIS